MPGTNAGTGYPLTLRCGKCKVGINFRDFHELQYRGTNLEATGRTRPLTRQQQGRCGFGALQYRVEYRCLDCGHVGWTRHVQGAVLLKRAGGSPPR